MKNKVQLISSLLACWNFQMWLTINCYFAAYGQKFKLFGSLNCLGVYKALDSFLLFSYSLKLKLSRAAIALTYILYSIKKHNMSFQNLIEQCKAN